MVSFNYQAKEVAIKIVYYGPGLCGKTTTLQYIYNTLPDNSRGKMISLATETDRTLFFDFLPIQLGKLKGLETKIQLYTVPGQVFYNQTRKLVLKGVDGIVFVADSQAGMLEANKESLQNLIQNLESLGMDLKDIPHVMQYNKRDLPNLIDVETLNKELNIYNVPYFETSAITGEGVIETLREIVRLTLKKITEKYNVEIEYMVEDESKEGEIVKEKDEPKEKEIEKHEKEENEVKLEPEEISAEDLAEMDTDIDFSVDIDDRIIGEDNTEAIESVDELDEIDEVEEVIDDESIEELEDVEKEELTEIEESEFNTQKIDSEVIEDRLETQEYDYSEIEVEAPRVVKADNGYFVPINIKIPEGMEDEVRINLDLKIEIKRKKRG
ncbi:hypothetical protein TTHT_1978 [Thermotomaculum hydrothermale]|uniref:Uncharacterized protein n=1 Tax=Thermotomaculum hydrothermale TaxID=981385 RepID=A0A7R6SZ98_9BACT|nr:hypothetical protein TTHT_1978 [Thermotomaculum hydrothermale]